MEGIDIYSDNLKPILDTSGEAIIQPGTPGKKKGIPKICFSCGSVIKGEFIRALGAMYHNDCFKCIDCNKVCVPKFFPCKENGILRPLCEIDYFKRFDLICAKCGGALRGPHIIALNKKYHLNHFTCSLCNVVFQPSTPYYEHNGNIYCKTHYYSSLFTQRCAGCHTPILRQPLEIKDNTDSPKKWHPECYMIYQSWNVKLELVKKASREQIIESKDFDIEIEKQKLVEEKISRIWTILSAFEESSTDCMAEILSDVSENVFLNDIEQAGNLVCHIDVLFSGANEIESKLKDFDDEIRLEHTEEQKLLAKRIVNFFSLFTHRNSFPLQDTTQEFLDLATLLADTYKVLIRFSLIGALKLENIYNDGTALDSFLDKFLTLGEMKSDLRQQLMTSNEFNIKSEYCLLCHNSVDEECIKLNDFRWHAHCFFCEVCKKGLYETYNEEARMDLTNKKLYCKTCSPPDTVDNFVYINPLEQYTFLLKLAFKKIIQNRYK